MSKEIDMKKVHISRLVLAGFKMVTALAYVAIAVLEYMGRNYQKQCKFGGNTNTSGPLASGFLFLQRNQKMRDYVSRMSSKKGGNPQSITSTFALVAM